MSRKTKGRKSARFRKCPFGTLSENGTPDSLGSQYIHATGNERSYPLQACFTAKLTRMKSAEIEPGHKKVKAKLPLLFIFL